MNLTLTRPLDAAFFTPATSGGSMKFTLEIDLTYFLMEDGRVNYTALADELKTISYRVDNGYDKGIVTPPEVVKCGMWSIK